jgi:ParB/RepB/Spo0J family partition protein
VVGNLDSGHDRRELVDVPVESIRLSELTARKTVDGKNLSDLASSIERHGVIEPVILREIDRGCEIVGGTRRFLAAQRIGMSGICHYIGASTTGSAAFHKRLHLQFHAITQGGCASL